MVAGEAGVKASNDAGAFATGLRVLGLCDVDNDMATVQIPFALLGRS